MNRKGIVFAVAAVLLLAFLCSCSSASDHTAVTAANPTAEDSGMAVLPLGAGDVFGMHYEEVIDQLQVAGFARIETVAIGDLSSANALYNGAVERIEVDGRPDFMKGETVPAEAKVVVTYHFIRQIEMPVFMDEVRTGDTTVLRRILEQAGFTDVQVSEAYDLEPGSIKGDFENEMTVGGSSVFRAGENVPYDTEIRIITHYPYKTFHAAVHIAMLPNLLKDPYDVIFFLNDEEQGTLTCREERDFYFDLRAGTYELLFCSSKDAAVSGSASFQVEDDTEAECRVFCKKDGIYIAGTGIEQADEPTDGEPQQSAGDAPQEDKPHYVRFTTNSYEKAKEGNTGVFAYKHKECDLYYIIDFDEGCVYCFTEDSKEVERVKIEFGNLVSGVIVTYHFSDRTESLCLGFIFQNMPEYLIVETGYEDPFFSREYLETDLEAALAIRDSQTIIDY